MSWKTLWCMTHLELGFYFIKKNVKLFCQTLWIVRPKMALNIHSQSIEGLGELIDGELILRSCIPGDRTSPLCPQLVVNIPGGISITGISGTGWWFPLLWKTNSALVGGFQIRDVNQTSNHCSCLTMIVGYYPLLTSVNHYNPNSSTVAIHPTVTRSFSSARGSPKRSRSRMILAALSVARWSNPGFAVLIKSYWV